MTFSDPFPPFVMASRDYNYIENKLNQNWSRESGVTPKVSGQK